MQPVRPPPAWSIKGNPGARLIVAHLVRWWWETLLCTVYGNWNEIYRTCCISPASLNIRGSRLARPTSLSVASWRSAEGQTDGLHGEMVSRRFGKTGSVLPELVKSLGKTDFMFHDCGHSREDYVSDFDQVGEILRPGAVVHF